MHTKRPRRIKVFTDQEIMDDLEKYRKSAIELGAVDALIIPSEKVPVDDRVRIKCIIPKCPSYGRCAHCPPHSLEPQQIRELVRSYRYGLLAKIEIEPSILLGENFSGVDEKGRPIPTKRLMELLKLYRNLADIVTEIESQAFYDGHYLATAFSAGSCNANYCNGMECVVLKGQACRFALRARPSLGGSSIDAYKMAAEAGWEIYPIGMDCNPEFIPYGTVMGLVMVE